MNKRQKGILLITVLAMVAVLVMFLTIMSTDLRSGLYFSRTYTLEKRSYWAAMAGLAYAEHMVQLNSCWCANATAASIGNPGISVEEQYTAGGAKQYRTSHGIVNNGEGEFYISFANTDGTITPARDVDGKELTYYSHNRLSISSESPSLAVTTSSVTRDLPANALYVAVEGRTKGYRTYVEAIYLINRTETYSSASISSGALNVNQLNSKSSFVITSTVGDNPKLKSNDTIAIGDGTTSQKILDMGSGAAVAMNEVLINGNSVTTSNQDAFGIQAQVGTDSSDEFPRINWNQVSEKYGNPDDSSSSFDGTLAAGTYAFLEGTTPATKGTYTLTYFKKEFDDTFLPDESSGIIFKDNKGALVSGCSFTVPGGGSGLHADGLQITVTSSTGIKSDTAAGLSGFALAAYDWDSATGKYILSTKGRAKVTLQKNASPDKTTSICSSGQVSIAGELSGSGAVVAGGDVAFQGRSELEPDATTGMAIYARGSVNLNRIAVKETVQDPSDKLKEAFKNYDDGLKGKSETIKDIKKASREMLDTMLSTGKPAPDDKISLRDVLAGSPYNYDSNQAQELTLQLLSKNTNGNAKDGYTAILPSDSEWCDVVPRDSKVKGIIYTWKNFNADLDGGSLLMKGALVAYGGDPATDSPGSSGTSTGQISIKNGQAFNLIFDPNYLSLLGEEATKVKLQRVMYNQMDR